MIQHARNAEPAARKLRIAVLDDYQDAFRKLSSYQRLAGHDVVVFHNSEKDPARLVARLEGFDVVLLTQQRTPFPRAVIEKLPELKLLVQTGDHLEHIDVAACRERGLPIAAGRGGIPSATAELTWALILASRRHIPREVEGLKQGVWQSTVGAGLEGRILGILGLGRIGSHVARVGAAFGMRVICLGRDASRAKAQAQGFEWAVSRKAFFEEADIVSLHTNLTEETRGSVTAEDLARMKATALIVNTSRAALIAPGALVAALERGHPGFAAVDVYEDEPVRAGNHPLLGMPNVVCTPHLGYVEERAYESYFGIAVEEIIEFARGNLVNIR